MLERAEAKFLITGCQLAFSRRFRVGETVEKICIDQLRSRTRSPKMMFPFAEADPKRPAYICFTSGSTGYPKGVVLAGRPLRTRDRRSSSLRDQSPDEDRAERIDQLRRITRRNLDDSRRRRAGWSRSSKTLVARSWRENHRDAEDHASARYSISISSIRPRPFPSLQCISASQVKRVRRGWSNPGQRLPLLQCFGQNEGDDLCHRLALPCGQEGYDRSSRSGR